MKQEIHEFFYENALTKAIMWLIVAFYPIYITCATNYISSGSKEAIKTLIFGNTGSFIFAWVIVSIFFISFLGFFRKVTTAAFLTGVLFFSLAIVDYLKFTSMENHLYPSDFLFVQNASNFSDFVTLPVIQHGIWEVVISTIIYCGVFFFIGIKLNLKRKISVTVSVLCLLFLVLFIANGAVGRGYEKLFGIDRQEATDQVTLFEKHGFITAFTLNFNGLNIATPDEYSYSTVERKFKKYLATQEDVNFQNPDVVVVLSESFWDPTQLKGVTFSEDPLKNYREIAKTNPSGKMVSPTFGGGTVRPEFEILSGMTTSTLPTGNIPYQQYVTDNTDSFAWFYKHLGYDTVGIHTYQKNFYDRDKAYPFMGFDEFLGEYDLHAEQHWNSGPYITDETIAEEVLYQLDQERDNSVFVMAITMENHGLYRDKFDEEDKTIKVTSNDLSESQISNLENYVRGTSDSDKALKEIYDYVMQREKPTVVLWFGDHLPTLGEDFEPYTTTGTISSSRSKEWSDEEKMTMFSTPYLVFSNYDTGKEYKAEDVPVSPYYLSALVADYIDAPKNLQTNFLLDLFDTSPVISKYYELYTPDSDVKKREELMELHELMTYDLLMGERYLLEMQK